MKHSVHPLLPPFLLGEGVVETATKFSIRWGGGGGGGLDWTSTFRGGLVAKRRVTFFRGDGCNFYIKDELKSEIFND